MIKFKINGKFGGVMYLEGLDNIDRKILELLSSNARMSYVDIGNEINLSRVAAKMRVQSLEEKGIIEKYSIVINPQKIERTISTFFDIEIEPSKFLEIVDILKKLESITQIYQMTGNLKLHIHAIFSSDEELELFITNIIYKLPGIRNLSINTIINRIKDIKEIKL